MASIVSGARGIYTTNRRFEPVIERSYQDPTCVSYKGPVKNQTGLRVLVIILLIWNLFGRFDWSR